MKKLKAIFLLIGILQILNLGFTSKAQENNGIIELKADKQEVEIGEEFTTTLEAQNVPIATYLLRIYFDESKLDLVIKPENSNVVDGTILYSWYNEQGKNRSGSNEKLIELKFKAKQNGVSMVSIQGEFYNKQEENINVAIEPVEVKIGKEEQITTEDEKLLAENQTDNHNSTNLAILRVNQEGITPDFLKGVKEYYLTIGEEIDKLDITALPENEDSKVTITGNKNLKTGLNTISIKVVSENEEKEAEYKIYVTKTEDKQKANANLETLAIENEALEPLFWEGLTHYQVTVDHDVENLNILAIPQREDGSVKITGQNHLKEGNNQVTVTVTAPNDITFKKYQVNVYRKSSLEMEAEKQENENGETGQVENNNQEAELMDNSKEIEEKEQEQDEREQNNALWIIGGIIVVMLLAGVIAIIVIKKRK